MNKKYIIYKFNYRLLKALPYILNMELKDFAKGLGVTVREVENWCEKQQGLTFEKFELMCRTYRLNPAAFIYVDDDSFDIQNVKDWDYQPIIPHFRTLINDVRNKKGKLKREQFSKYGVGQDRYSHMMKGEPEAWTITIEVLLRLVNMARVDLNNIIHIPNGEFTHIAGYDLDLKDAIDEDVDETAKDFVAENIGMVREECKDVFQEKVKSKAKDLKDKVNGLFSEPEE